MAGEQNISPLILAELYDASDEAFVERLANFRGNFKPLVGVIEKWKKDKSAWARRMKIRFLTDVELNEQHRLVFKRLFKQAWHDGDHELMGVFMAVLDRAVRRRRNRVQSGITPTGSTTTPRRCGNRRATRRRSFLR